MDSRADSSASTCKEMIKNFYALCYVDKEDLENRLEESKKKILSAEIQRMLDEKEDGTEDEPDAGDQSATLPAIRVLPITDQLTSLEKTLSAYAIVLSRCVQNLKARIHDFRLNDSIVK